MKTYALELPSDEFYTWVVREDGMPEFEVRGVTIHPCQCDIELRHTAFGSPVLTRAGDIIMSRTHVQLVLTVEDRAALALVGL